MDFLTYRGILGDIGTIESNSTFYSDSSTRTSGVGAGTEIMNNLVIGGDMHRSTSNSITRQHTKLTLSFLKINDKVYSDLIIPKLAMYEILKKGHEIGIIVEDNELLAAKNFTTGIKFKKDGSRELKSDSSLIGLFLVIFFGGLLCLINVFYGLLFLGVGIFFTFKSFVDKNNYNKAIFDENEKNLRLAFEKIAWGDQVATPIEDIASSTCVKIVDIYFENKIILSVKSNTILGKNHFKHTHVDFRYYDDRQFSLIKSGSNWMIEHCDGAPLETIVNGIKLTGSKVVTDGMIVSVGYSEKQAEKMPIMLKLA